MNSQNTLRSRITVTIIHLAVLLIIAFIISKEFPLNKMDGNYLWHSLGNLSLLIITFYLFTFTILPSLLKGKNLKLFSTLTIFLFIVFTLASNWISALHSAAITYLDPSVFPDPSILTRPEPYSFFKEHFFDFFILTLIGAIPFIATSFFYYFITASKKERSRLLDYKYTELIINIIVLSFIYSMSLSYTRDYNLLWVLPVLLSLTIFFYLIALVITPGIFQKKKRDQYIIAALAVIFLQFIVFALILGQLSKTSSVIGKFYPQVLFIFLIAFTYGYLRIKKVEKQKKFNLELNTKDSELSLLKSQVNPHFLFNILNTLYSTALEEKSPKTSESIFKLANLLRYMQNDMGKNHIPLEHEINYLKDYMDIQELRCEVQPHVDTLFQNTSGYAISPGLFIPFVENAFKYGVDPNIESSLSVSVICKGSKIHFKCSNSYNSDLKTFYKEQGFGIGIKNTKERLKLAYPNKHDLQITKTENQFTVMLELTT